MAYVDAFSKVLPVILLFILGALLRRTRFLGESTVADLKKLIVNVTLPAVLFLAFAGVDLEARHLAVVGLVFAFCGLALLAGRLIGRPAGLPSPYFPALMTGFEAGMMGYAIFGAVYGASHIFNFAVVDLGQVTFVFFVLVPFVQRLATGITSAAQTVLGFLKTPVIIAIFLGIAVNRLGLEPVLRAWPPTEAAFKTLELLAAVTTPLIALVIGYEVRLQRGHLLQPVKTIALRLLFWVPAGLLLNALVVRPLFEGDTLLQAAVMTMFVLPPPFVVPLFMGKSTDEERTFVVNTLSLATLVTLVAFTAITVVYR